MRILLNLEASKKVLGVFRNEPLVSCREIKINLHGFLLNILFHIGNLTT